MNDLTVVALSSGGKDSTAMALRLEEAEPDTKFQFVCTPTGNELPDMVEHWANLKSLLSGDFRVITSGKSLFQLIRSEKMIPNSRARFCTRILKIYPFAGHLMEMTKLFDQVSFCIGIRADEPLRESGDYSKVPDVVERFPLREWKWDIRKVQKYLMARDVVIPARTDCAVCFYQRISEWYALWQNHPEEYEKGVQIEKEMGYTFRRPKQDSWPAALEDLRNEFIKGRIPRGAPTNLSLFQGTDLRKCRVCRI